ncbi:MAG TPA: iron ABC transporter permease [Anaerolineales bacterium]|nr:iron ABC transporter permease [Anaerolineales bacterium]
MASRLRSPAPLPPRSLARAVAPAFFANAAALFLLALPLLFLALFYVYPLVSILRLGLAPQGRLDLAPLAALAGDAHAQRVVGFTLWQAVLSTLLTLAVGLPGAYLVARYDFRGKGLLRALAGVPFVMPTLVVAAAFNALIGPRGWINLGLMALFRTDTPPLNLMNTLGAILLAHIFYNTTIVLRLVGDFWAHLDPRLAGAARVLGADGRRAFTHVTLPLLAPAILAAALLVFIFDFTSFGVILVLGGPRFATLEVEIYRQTISLFNLPTAAALSLTQLACTLAFTLLYARLSARVTAPLPLRPQAFTQQPLNTWRARLAAGVIVGGLLALLVAPLAALALRSFTRLEAARGERTAVQTGFTLAFYQELFVNRRESIFYAPPFAAVGNSVGVAAATTFLSLALSLPTALALTRSGSARLNRSSQIPFREWLDSVLMLPLGTSAVTLGLGFLVAFSRPPLAWRASPLLLPLAHTLVAFPFVVRSLSPALRGIRPQLRRAAASLGASPLRAFQEVDLPLIGRAVMVGGAFAFAISLGEFGATALVARPDFPTIPIAIYTFLSQPGALNYGQALALSTILMAVCAGGILAIESLRVGEVGEF